LVANNEKKLIALIILAVLALSLDESFIAAMADETRWMMSNNPTPKNRCRTYWITLKKMD